MHELLHLAVAVPEASEKAISYYYAKNTLWAVGLLWGIAVPALVLFTGWSARMRDAAARVSSRWAVHLFLYLLIYGAVTAVLALPVAYYDEFVLEHDFALSNQSFAKWATDSAIAFVVGTIISYVFLLGVYRLLARSPKRWWLYMGLASIPIVVLLFLVTPIWIEPLFNKFGPMKDQALEAKILALADRAGIEGSRVFEVEKSEDTKKLNAYVSGFFDTKRIVLSDTLIKAMDEKEVLFVMGHEMAHYVLGHVWSGIVVICTLVFLALYATHRLAHRLIDRHRARFGFDRLEDMASWPLVNILMSLVFVVALPIVNLYFRHGEHEADRFGLEITQDSDAAARAFVKLNSVNLALARPNAFLHAIRESHPTLAERIEFANTYRPWERGERLKYQEHFSGK